MLYKVFVCARVAGSCNCSALNENLRFCSSAETGIVLNLFLNFEQK